MHRGTQSGADAPRRWRHIRPLLSALPAFAEGRCWRLGGRPERPESFQGREESGNRPRGLHRPSGVKKKKHLQTFPVSARFVSVIGAEKCRPVVSLASAGPSRPGRCWSTTQRSYLMTIAPPPEALYSPPLPGVRQRRSVFLFFIWQTKMDGGRDVFTETSVLCHRGLPCHRDQNKNKEKPRPLFALAAIWLAGLQRRDFDKCIVRQLKANNECVSVVRFHMWVIA